MRLDVLDADSFGDETLVGRGQIVHGKTNLHSASDDSLALVEREVKKGAVVPGGRRVCSRNPAIIAAVINIRHQWNAKEVAVEAHRRVQTLDFEHQQYKARVRHRRFGYQRAARPPSTISSVPVM